MNEPSCDSPGLRVRYSQTSSLEPEDDGDDDEISMRTMPKPGSVLDERDSKDSEEEEEVGRKKTIAERLLQICFSFSTRLFDATFWTWATIFGQIFVLGIAVAFFLMIELTRTPMDLSWAVWARSSPRGLAYIVSGISTILSIISTFFFSKALILFITAHSNRSTSFINFLTMTHLSRSAPIFSANHVTRTLLSFLAIALLKSITASFTTLLTPIPLIVRVPLLGKELNLDSDILHEAYNNKTFAQSFPALDSKQLSENDKLMVATEPLIFSNAYAAGRNFFRAQGAVSYMGFTFTSPTGGVLPVLPEYGMLSLFQIDAYFSSVKPRFSFVDPNFRPSQALPYNYTTSQQGFTAEVSCRALPANQSSEDSGYLKFDFLQNLTLPGIQASSIYNITFKCPKKETQNFTRTIRPGGNLLIGATCKDSDFQGDTGGRSQSIILGGYGPKCSFITPRVCKITPYFTSAEVLYNENGLVGVKTKVKIQTTPKADNVAGMILDSVQRAIDEYWVDGSGNVGVDISSILQTAETSDKGETSLNYIISNYFRGIIEARATLIKTPPIKVGLENPRFVARAIEDLTDEWKVEFNGTWSYETLGWHRASKSVFEGLLGLLPISLVTLSSIILSLNSWILLRRSDQNHEDPFDPNDLVALLKAGRDGLLVESLRILEDQKGELESFEQPKRDLRIKLQLNQSDWEIFPVLRSP